MRGALIKFMMGKRGDDPRDDGRRIFGAMRVGDMPLFANDPDQSIDRSSTANRYCNSKFRNICRLANNAMTKPFAARARPIKKFDCAIKRGAFLIAGDEERKRALGLP